MSNEMIPQYDTKLFNEIYEDADAFIEDYEDNGIPVTISEENATTLYYLLYAKYGNSPIANYDENQFKYKVFSTIFMYGPSWEKRLDIQAKLRGLSEDDITKGAKTIYNHAFNPGTAPSTGSLEELNYINDQNTSNYKRAKLDAYSQLWDLLATDVTTDFLNKFKGCFKQFVAPERTHIYVTDLEDEED